MSPGPSGSAYAARFTPQLVFVVSAISAGDAPISDATSDRARSSTGKKSSIPSRCGSARRASYAATASRARCGIGPMEA